MDSKKIIWFNVISMVLVLSTLFLYLNKGLAPLSYTSNYFYAIFPVAISVIMILIINLLVNLSYVISRALYKKNLLRFSMIFLVLIFLINLVGRIYEIFVYNYFCFGCYLNLILYIILIVLNFILLKDLYELTRELFGYQK